MGGRSNILRHSCTNMLDGILSPEVDSPVNVSYLLDTSGSMYLAHDLVRKHLVDHLITRAHAERVRRAHTFDHGRLLDHARQFEHVPTCRSSQTPVFKYSRFNIIAFTDSSNPWADNVVDLTPENVALASQWVKQMLRVKTGPSHIFQTLLVALHDPNVDQIVLITDAAPADFSFRTDFSRIAIAAKGRPIHTVLIETPSSSTHTFKVHPDCEVFAKKITHLTGAVFRKLSIDVTGRFFDEIQLIKEKRYDKDCSSSSITGLCSGDDGRTTLAFDRHAGCHQYFCPPCTCTAMPVWRSSHFKALKMPNVPSLDAASLLLGREVLCRRNKDGFYYLATVSEYVPGSPRFFVTFGKSNSQTPEIEEVFLDNIVNLDDCLRNPIGKGDKVLASVTGKKEGPYCTGIVMDGSDARTGFPCNENQNMDVAFSTGDVKSLSSDMVVKVPERFHGKASHEQGVPPVQRRALQLAEEDIQREQKPDICSGVPVQPALNCATRCCPYTRCYYLPVCSGYGSTVQKSFQNEKVTGIEKRLCECFPDYTQQEIILTRHKPSFVRADELNQTQEEERIPQPFVRSDDQEWFLYQQEPCTHRCRVSCKCGVDKHESDDDDEFDEFLTDVRTWGDRRNVATDTDLSLLYPESGNKLGKRPPWRYWKQKNYEKQPSEQPAYLGDEVVYAPTRSISIKDTSGVSGCSKSHHIYYEPERNLEHSSEEIETDVNQTNDYVTSEGNGKNASFVTPLAEAVTENDEGNREAVVKSPDCEVSKDSTENKELVCLNGEAVQNEQKSEYSHCERGDIPTVPVSQEQLMKDHVRGHWALEANRYFDDIRDNLRLQHSRQWRTMNQRR